MKTESLSRDRELWCRNATRVANRLNVHHGLSNLVPKMSIALLILGVMDLALREVGVAGSAILLFGGVLLLGIIVWSIVETWPRFKSGSSALEMGLIRLETILRLNNGLSAAYAGGLPWPRYVFAEPHEQSLADNGGYVLNWREFLLKPLAALTFFLVAGLVPVHPMHPYAATLATQLPPDLVQVQNWLDKLKEENLIEPDKLKEAEDQLDQFKNRSPKEWYTQENLEGADALKESMAQSLTMLQNGLDKADQALQDGLDKTSTSPNGMQGLSKEDKQALQDEMKKAGNALGAGSLPAKQEVVKQLTGADSADEASMTREQMEKLQKRLAQAKAAAASGSGKGSGDKGDGDGDSKLSQEMQNAMKKGEMTRGKGKGNGSGGGNGEPGGPGGTGGGNKTAPLELEQRELFADGTQQKIKASDPSNSVPGELVNVSAEAPKVDSTQAPASGATGGTAQIQGNGGEAVWRSDYDPDEAEVLRTYFK